MRPQHSYRIAAASFFAFGAQLMAQTSTPTPFPAAMAPAVLQQSFTTGMVGFTLNQTARLNVLNLNPTTATPAANTPPNCTVELQFLDGSGNQLKQTVVPNFEPGTATSLDLIRVVVPTPSTGRTEIRGVVVVNPAPTPVASPAAVGFCTVMTTLEIFDITGSTVALTSDTRSTGVGIVPPLRQGNL
jgi:hypothetical protein